tara:strand:+ start:1175 stop:1459 length:285 start_codon:yes stop_codon:yes gene_type:complete
MRSYPIWNKVQACIYKGSKDWGAKDECSVSIKVGTSAKYSFDFVDHRTTRRTTEDGEEFRFYVNDKLIKRSLFNTKTKEYKELSTDIIKLTGIA